MEELADHGITLPPNMQGLTEEQIEDLKLKDEWAECCQPSGGHIQNKDDIGRRNGMGNCWSIFVLLLLADVFIIGKSPIILVEMC